MLQKGMGLHGRIQDKVRILVCGQRFLLAFTETRWCTQIVEGMQGRQYVDLKFKHPEP